VRASRLWRIFAILLALTLVAAACGDDDDTTETGAGTEDTDSGDGGDGGDGDAGDGGEVSMDEEVEVATGTVLPLPDCPSDWSNTAGITDDEITLYQSLPESGPVAALGGLDDGMRAWFDQMEPIDGRTINLVSADDAYDPARTLSNVEDALETVDPFAMVYMIGTPSNFAIRDLLDEECVPQLFNSTGHPAWGDPAQYPWTIGGLISYATEAQLWCTYIQEELGPDTTVAALYMDNDFGLAYEDTVNQCDIDLVETVRHDPAAADVTDEITTLAASDADAVLLGTTGAPCPQAMAAIAQSSWDPEVFLSNTCQGIATYFAPIDPAGDGVIVAATAKEAGELEDEDVMAAREALEAAGLNPDEGSFYTGVIFAHTIENVLRSTAEKEGGLTRVNLMETIWNADFSNPLAIDGGTYQTSGTDDAYLVEAAQFVRYRPPAEGEELGRYEPVGEVLNLEGETGTYQGG
jgi:branched-chain amino acid transport system substrate-binding protein